MYALMLQLKLLEKVIDFGVMELVKQIRCLGIEIYDDDSVNTAVNSKNCVQQFQLFQLEHDKNTVHGLSTTSVLAIVNIFIYGNFIQDLVCLNRQL